MNKWSQIFNLDIYICTRKVFLSWKKMKYYSFQLFSWDKLKFITNQMIYIALIRAWLYSEWKYLLSELVIANNIRWPSQHFIWSPIFMKFIHFAPKKIIFWWRTNLSVLSVFFLLCFFRVDMKFFFFLEFNVVFTCGFNLRISLMLIISYYDIIGKNEFLSLKSIRKFFFSI